MRAVRIVGLSAGRHQATALVTRIGGQPDARLVVIEDQDPGTGPAGGEVIATMAVDDWHRTPTRSRQPITDRLHWSKPIIDGLEPGTRYRLRIIDEGNGELAEAIVTTAPAADCDRFRLATGSCFDRQHGDNHQPANPPCQT